MTLKNCEICGKVFNSETENDTTCPECSVDEQKQLKKVADYLRKFPMANVMEVHEKTGVSRAQVLKLVKCRICGVPVKTGNICGKCRLKVEKGLSGRDESGDKTGRRHKRHQ